jgi:hypothetical protein
VMDVSDHSLDLLEDLIGCSLDEAKPCFAASAGGHNGQQQRPALPRRRSSSLPDPQLPRCAADLAQKAEDAIRTDDLRLTRRQRRRFEYPRYPCTGAHCAA